MKKTLALLIILFSLCLRAEALQIVYPKTNPVKINSPSTFFIGSANPSGTIKINDIEVKTGLNGAFAQTVQLNYGINNFKIISSDEQIDFTIERPQPQAAAAASKLILIEYPCLSFIVANDNAPLRTTPVSAGINRLSHLPCGTNVVVNGEKGNFYRVYLDSQTVGWIAKTDVTQVQTPQNMEFDKFKLKQDKDYNIYEFELSGKAPFVLKEENGLSLKIFNVNNQPDCTYSFDIPASKLLGYDIFYEESKLVLKVRNQITIDKYKPLKDIKIVVDAGHGGCEKGAIGGCGDMEKDINLAIAKNLKQELEARGAKVIMTRDSDCQISLGDRVKLAKESDAVLSISIHSNALPDGQDPIKSRGTSVYYYHPQAKSLADSIIKTMTEQLGMQNDKVRQGSLALVRPTSSVSILIEVGYIINPDDYVMLLAPEFQKNCAKAIADGIEDYLRQ